MMMQEVSTEEEESPLPTLLLSSDSDQDDKNKKPNNKNITKTREICYDGCGRPSTVCICRHLPPQPIATATTILILHHPHELRNNKLSTLPALTRSLLNSHRLSGRLLRLGSHPLLDSLYHHSPSKSTKTLFLFPSADPSSPAADLSRWAAETLPADRADPVLIVFDGTWKQAKEMANASLPFLSRFAIRVEIGRVDVTAEGESTFESDLVLRKEPFLGCVSTLEAAARALRVLEPEGVGVEIERRLIGVLRAMVAFQACHLKPVKPRPRLRKKKEMRREKEVEG